MMHKKLYASGFLYHIPSQQILLQHKKADSNTQRTWSLFGGDMSADELLHEAFQRIIHQILAISLHKETISAIYEYYNTELEKDQVLVYAEVAEMKEFPSDNSGEYVWVKLKDIYKLPMPVQMKHDITVGRRVIDAKQRGILDIQSEGEIALINEA
jgi:ADP-ribose pyrophosphatase YjhB (NUDIX family)